jgi:outer membrane protein TolC
MNNSTIAFRNSLTMWLTRTAMWLTRTAIRRSKLASNKAIAFKSQGGQCPPYNSVCPRELSFRPTLFSLLTQKRQPEGLPELCWYAFCGLAFRPTLFSSSNKKHQPEGRPTIKNADLFFNMSRACSRQKHAGMTAPTKAASRFVMVLVFGLASFNAHAQTMSYEQVLQQVVDNYPSLQTTAMAVERARLESVRVESQLGWQLNAAAGMQHDMSQVYGTTVDRMNLNGNMSRLLESGDTLGFLANVNREDAEITFPGAPNPSLNTHVGVNYRMPLQEGADNTSLVQSRQQAEVAVAQATADRRSVYDQIAAQLIDLYTNAAAIRARIDNTQQSIQRGQRLLKYNEDRAKLGIAEEKDLLQARAQLRGREAELSALEMQWQAQRINLNRLMGRDINADLQLQTEKAGDINQNAEELMQQATQHSPSMAAIQARLKQADTAIELSRDKRKDKLDLVLSAGYKRLDGSGVTGDINAGEPVGGVQLEYARGLDLSGYDAELQQAQLTRSAALQDQKQVLQDLQYNIAGVQAEINAGIAALKAYEISAASEQAKLKEATQRYRQGRNDTDQLIQFEAQLSTAELNTDLQAVELQRRAQRLRLIVGDIWKTVRVE